VWFQGIRQRCSHPLRIRFSTSCGFSTAVRIAIVTMRFKVRASIDCIAMRTHILSIARVVAGCLFGVATVSGRCAPAPADLAAGQGATPPSADRSLYCGGVSPVITRGSSSGALGTEPPKTLSDLVGIAMKNNPDTRVAWTQAEEAALNLGITRSKYGPMLAAQAAGLYERSTFPLPKSLIPSGYFKSDAEGLIPALTFKWLLYDFGGRSAAIEEADQTLAGANFGFTATHRKVSISVTQRFYSLATQVARKAAAQA
jgi:outer membrane protein TolC